MSAVVKLSTKMPGDPDTNGVDAVAALTAPTSSPPPAPDTQQVLL